MNRTDEAPLTRDQRGLVYAEFIMAFTPFFLLFLGIIQLVFIATGGMVVQTAATKGVRAATVILPDDRFFYDGEKELLLDFQGTSDNSGFLSGLKGALGRDGAVKSPSGDGPDEQGTGGPRLNQIRLAVYLALASLAPAPQLLLTWIPSGLGLEKLFDDVMTGFDRLSLRKTAIGESPTFRFFTGLFVYNPIAAAVNFPVAPGAAQLLNEGEDFAGRVDLATVENKQLTIRVTYLFPCTVPVVNAIICRRINPGPLLDTLGRTGLDEAALDACGASCSDALEGVQDVYQQGAEIVRDVRQQYEQTRDSVTEAYNEVKGQITEEYDAAKKYVTDTYDERKQELQTEYERQVAAAQETYERALRDVPRDQYQQVRAEAQAKLDDATERARRLHEGGLATATEAYESGMSAATRIHDEARETANATYERGMGRVQEATREGLETASQGVETARDEAEDRLRELGENARSKIPDNPLGGAGLPGGGFPGGSGSGLPGGGFPGGGSPGAGSGAPGLPGGAGAMPGGGGGPKGLPNGFGGGNLPKGLPGGGALKEWDPKEPARFEKPQRIDTLKMWDVPERSPLEKYVAALPSAAKEGDGEPAADGPPSGGGRNVNDALRDFEKRAGDAVGGFEQKADEVVGGFEQGVGNVVNGAPQRAANAADSAERSGTDAVGGAQRDVTDAVGGAQRDVTDAVGGAQRDATDAVDDTEQDVSGAVKTGQDAAGNAAKDAEGWFDDIADTFDDMLPDWFKDTQTDEERTLMKEMRAGVKQPAMLDILLRAPGARFHVLRAEATLPLQVAEYAYPTAEEYKQQDEEQQQQQQQQGPSSAVDFPGMPGNSLGF